MTAKNLITNPRAGTATTGYSTNGTLGRVTGLTGTWQRTTAATATGTASGALQLAFPFVTFGSTVAGTAFDFTVQYTSTVSTYVIVTWENSSGGYGGNATLLGPYAANASPSIITGTFTAPTGTFGLDVSLYATSAGVGDVITGTAARLDYGATGTMPYADGASPGWSWDGGTVDGTSTNTPNVQNGAAAFAGAGALSASGTVTRAAAASFAGAGALTATATAARAAAAALGGSGTLSASATRGSTAAAALHGDSTLRDGTLTAGTFPSGTLYPGSTTYPGAGGVPTGGAFVTRFGVVTLMGGSRLTAHADVAPPLPPIPVLPVPPGPVIHRPPPIEQRLLVFDTITGRISYELPWTSMTWSSPLGGGQGQLRTTLPIVTALQSVADQGIQTPRESLREFLTGPYRYSFAVCYGATVLWAGPYVPAYDPPDAQSIDVAGVELIKLFEKRVMVNPGGVGDLTDPSYDYAATLTTKPTMMLNLVNWAISGDPSRSLPIFCANPPAQSVGEEVFRYRGYDLTTFAKAISDLTATIDGPDMRLDPYIYQGDDAEYVAWNLVIGDPYLDRGMPQTWDDSLATIQRDITPSDMASVVYATGSGQDRDKMISWASDDSLTRLGFPAIELVDTTHTSETDPIRLAQYAAGDIAISRAPIDQWTVRFPIAGPPYPGTYRPGDIARIDIRLHPILEPGTYYKRITGVAQDGTAAGWISMICMDPEADWKPPKAPYYVAG